MNQKDKVISILLAEEGYLEKKSNKNLDDKYANAGANNYTKYARDLDAIKNFYNGKKQGYAWCDVFVDWGFVKAFGVDEALRLLCQPTSSCGAGVGFSADYYKAKGQFYTSNPQPGDQIFFKDSKGNRVHTGLIYQVDKSYVYTIEGNTSSDPGVIPNGGCVKKKKYALNYKYIYGYGRPAYKVEPKPVTKKGYSGTFPKLPLRGYFKNKDKGTQVKNLQRLLNWLNGDKLAVDGEIGPLTINSVKKFQKSNGLVVDGLFGKKSLAKAKEIKK